MSQKKMAEYLYDYKHELLEIDQRSNFLARFVNQYDLAHITYYYLSDNLEKPSLSRLITTYSSDWKDHYFASGYGVIDPILRNGIKGFLPFDWSEVHKKNKTEKKFFGEAKEFGICDFGLTVPIRGANGEFALFSINSELSQREWDCYKRSNISDVLHFAHLFHDVIVRDLFVEHSKFSLSRREKQVLFWAGRGKTCWETAKILGLTERTADFYLRKATYKLGAVTKTQAVAKAIADGHISHTVDPA